MQIHFDTSSEIGTVTLSSPPHNTLTRPDFVGLDEFQAFFATPGMKAAVVRGDGREFCRGADLSALREQARAPEDLAAALGRGKQLLECVMNAPVPVAAAIRGGCLGAGLEIALACHFRVVATTAMLGFPESEQGLMPGLGGTLTTRITRPALIRRILSGDMVGGEEAVAEGLADRAVDPARVEPCARELLVSLVGRRSERLVRTAMQSIANGRRLPRREALLKETELFCSLAAAGEGDDA